MIFDWLTRVRSVSAAPLFEGLALLSKAKAIRHVVWIASVDLTTFVSRCSDH